MGFGAGINLFGGLFSLIFVLAFAVIVYGMIRNIRQWKQDNQAPRLTVEATVTAKRTRTTTQMQHQGAMPHTRYYATFQIESGERKEFHLAGQEYRMLAEGDFGDLTFQGTRYLAFQRK